jgi:hypothetical protein
MLFDFASLQLHLQDPPLAHACDVALETARKSPSIDPPAVVVLVAAKARSPTQKRCSWESMKPQDHPTLLGLC